MVGATQASASTTRTPHRSPYERSVITRVTTTSSMASMTQLAHATEAARAIVTTKTESGHFADQKRITIIVPSSAGCEHTSSPTYM